MKTRVIELMARKQGQTRQIVNSMTIVRETGLSRPTVNAWIKGDVKRFDEDTILALCKYFECDIGDLLTIADKD